ncbi:uncharacterized protein LOC113233099 isoform X2 [Hyposmocoma kahamanoa]|uniref:uncharacterized protein LOC113233099 isoform X2 n=1 Tax=Hyposmocoma kahamanoa TaxID=1477025 RepID=UPI000E6D5C78|nr:uncharacterized protein LOC113233099 isoform X2 [Hyposmocoma kahamanoa]
MLKLIIVFSCFTLSIRAQLWDNVYNNISVYENDGIVPISILISPAITTLPAMENVLPHMTCRLNGTFLSKYKPYVLSWYMNDVAVQSENNATFLRWNRTLSSVDINKEIYCGLNHSSKDNDLEKVLSSKKIQITKPPKSSPLDLIITPNVTELETTEGVVPNLICTPKGSNLPNYIPYVLSWYLEDIQLNSEVNAIALPLKKTFTTNDTNNAIYCAMKLFIFSDDVYTLVSGRKINITKVSKALKSPLDLIITPNVTGLETTEGVVPNVTCTPKGSNLPKYSPYVLSWYLEDIQLNSEVNAIALPLKKTFTMNDTNKAIYCAMKLFIFSEDVYTLVSGHKINITKVSKALKSGSDGMKSQLFYFVTFINLVIVSLVI